jgi:hypothetical protein
MRERKTAAPKFRIDVAINDRLTNADQRAPAPADPKSLSLPNPVFPEFSERLKDPDPEAPPDKRQWGLRDIYRTSRGWSRVLPGDFHPITAYLFIDYKCNLDCWYCWSYDNKSRHDSGRGPSLDRLAPRSRLPGCGSHGR